MRILYLLPDFVLPTRSGLHVREMSQLRVLSAMSQVESIRILTLSPTPVAEAHLRQLETEIPKAEVAEPLVAPRHIRSSPEAMLNFLRRRVCHGEPYLIATYNVPAMRDLIAQQLTEQDYDVVYISYLGMVAYLDTIRRCAPKARVILEQHNLEWQIFDRLADQSSPLVGPMIKVEARALKKYERSIMRRVDAVIAISETDATLIQELAELDPVVVPTYFERQAARTERPSATKLGYIGHLGWQPNAIGLDWFFKEVWPKVRARCPDAALTVAGPGLKQGASGALEAPPLWRQPGVEIAGFVDDLEALYAQTLGMIAPVIGGSGVRMKLLETMGAGMPTVTTPDGAAGLAVVHDKELLIAEDPDAFADNVVRLLSDPGLRQRLRENGYAFLEEHHALSVAKDRMKDALQ